MKVEINLNKASSTLYAGYNIDLYDDQLKNVGNYRSSFSGNLEKVLKVSKNTAFGMFQQKFGKKPTKRQIKIGYINLKSDSIMSVSLDEKNRQIIVTNVNKKTSKMKITKKLSKVLRHFSMLSIDE